MSLTCPALAAGFFTTSTIPGKPIGLRVAEANVTWYVVRNTGLAVDPASVIIINRLLGLNCRLGTLLSIHAFTNFTLTIPVCCVWDGLCCLAPLDERSEVRESKYFAHGHMVYSGRAQKMSPMTGLWIAREPCSVRSGECE